MSEREGSQRERGATTAVRPEGRGPDRREERALSEREGSQRERERPRRERALRSRGPAVVALGCSLLLSAGCAGNMQIGQPPGVPDCAAPGGRVADAMILIAQSVPSAQLLPCLRTLPVGWAFQHLDVRNGRTEVLLRSDDRNGEHRVTVVLEPRCDVAGAREVASDQPDTRRYDRVAQIDSGYVADRHYVFAGGCVTYHVNLRRRVEGGSVAAILAGLGFLARSTVAASVSERSHGRLTLDPGGQR